MDFRILGPLEVRRDGGPVQVSGPRQRALLVDLLLHRNEVVSSDRLAEDMWGGRAPPNAKQLLWVHVSRLRKTLGTDALQRRPAGYVLHVEADELDLARFERLVDEARGSEPAQAAAQLREALGLWRGPALADVRYDTFAALEIVRLEELRLAALEARIDAELSLGLHSELIGELEALVAEHPSRERLRALLMLALYRSGRQADALDSYRHAREALAEELGLEPGPELRRLQRAILEQDPSLDAEGAARPEPAAAATRRRRVLMLGAGAILAAGAAAAALSLSGSDGPPAVIAPPNAVSVIDVSSNAVVAATAVGNSPGPVAPGEGAVWAINRNDSTLAKIDPVKKQVVSVSGGVLPLHRIGSAALLAVGEGAVWISEGLSLVEFDPVSDSIVRTLDVTPRVDEFWTGLAAGMGSVWLSDGRPRLLEVEYPRMRAVPLQREDPAGGPGAGDADRFPTFSFVAIGLGAVWVAFADPGGLGAVFRYDPSTGEVVRLSVNARPSGIAVGQGSVWVTDSRGDAVVRVGPEVTLMTRIPVGDEPVAVAVGGGAVWTANAGDGTISRIDPEQDAVAATIRVGHRPQGIAVANGLVWVTQRPG